MATQRCNPTTNFEQLFSGIGQATLDSLEAEIRELRNEIKHLRSELAPVPSMILTGQQVLAEFKRISECQ
jgi:prefoldin subunit 5